MHRLLAIAFSFSLLLTICIGEFAIADTHGRVTCGPIRGKVVRLVRPKYPEQARQAGIEGRVSLSCLIGKDGVVKHIEVIRGHELLAPAAVEAVKQWKYKPVVLNGVPVEVETQVDINFELHNGTRGARAIH